MVRFSPSRRNRRASRKTRRGVTRKARRTTRTFTRSPGTGMVRIKRQAQSVVIRNTGVAGVPTAVGYNSAAVVNNLVQLGLPEADNNYSHAIYNVPFSCQFSMNQVVNNAELTNIADRYKIAGVSVKVKYNYNEFNGQAGTTNIGNQPVVKWVRDNDDSAPLSVSALQQKTGLTERMLGAGRFCKMYLKPKVAGYAIGGAAAGGIVMKSQYLNSSQIDIPHYGIKGFIEGMNLQATSQLDSVIQFEFTYYLTLRDLQ